MVPFRGWGGALIEYTNGVEFGSSVCEVFWELHGVSMWSSAYMCSSCCVLFHGVGDTQVRCGKMGVLDWHVREWS